MVRIQEDDFSIEEVIDNCIGPRRDVGGIATFVGVVRNISGGKDVEKIELTHYEGMALKELAKVRERAVEKFDIAEMSIVHRVGTLYPGDRIVGIVAAARHRGPAFDACRFAIDELKKTVPIWKRETTPDGQTWVEPTP
jgi:molybdopterin synthase catalytic subunit